MKSSWISKLVCAAMFCIATPSFAVVYNYVGNPLPGTFTNSWETRPQVFEGLRSSIFFNTAPGPGRHDLQNVDGWTISFTATYYKGPFPPITGWIEIDDSNKVTDWQISFDWAFVNPISSATASIHSHSAADSALASGDGRGSEAVFMYFVASGANSNSPGLWTTAEGTWTPPVPEPSGAAMLAFGLLALVGYAAGRRQASAA